MKFENTHQVLDILDPKNVHQNSELDPAQPRPMSAHTGPGEARLGTQKCLPARLGTFSSSFLGGSGLGPLGPRFLVFGLIYFDYMLV